MKKKENGRQVAFKRALAAILILIMCISIMPSAAFAADPGTGDQTITSPLPPSEESDTVTPAKAPSDEGSSDPADTPSDEGNSDPADTPSDEGNSDPADTTPTEEIKKPEAPTPIETEEESENKVTLYAATAFTEIKIAEKKLTGDKTLEADEFTFELTALKHTGGDVYALAPSTTITRNNTAAGDISIPGSIFTAEFKNEYCQGGTASEEVFEGTYTFLLKERNDSKPGYTYDSNSYAINITFAKNDETGEIKALVVAMTPTESGGGYAFSSVNAIYYSLPEHALVMPSGAKVGYVPFNNKYDATEAGSSIKIAEKKLTGSKALEAGEFTFELTPLSLNEILGDVYTLAPSTETITLKNTASGDISLLESIFTAEFKNKYCRGGTTSEDVFEGTYSFLLKELKEDKPGYTYDENIYAISITFYKNGTGGQETVVSAMKPTALDGDLYSFSTDDLLYSTDDFFVSDPEHVGYVPFNNEYKTTETGPAIKIAEKKLDGKGLEADEFTFKLTPLTPLGLIPDLYCIPDSTETFTLKNTASGDISIPESVFTAEFKNKYCQGGSPLGGVFDGTYSFLLEEIKEGKPGYTYDETIYAINISFSQSPTGGSKIEVIAMEPAVQNGVFYAFSPTKAICSSLPGGSAPLGYAPFNNTFETTGGILQVSKTISGDGADPEKAFAFTVSLKDGAGTALSGSYGGLTFTDGKASFDLKGGESKSISGLPVGTVYEVTENSGVYTATISVDGETKTEAKGTIASNTTAEVRFDNHKDKAQALTDVKIAEKKLEGNKLKANQFTFKLTPFIHGASSTDGYTLADSGETITLTNAENGDIYLDIGVFTKEFHDKYCYDHEDSDEIFVGAYAFLIEEVNAGETGYTYDSETYAIDVTFIDEKLFDVAAMPYTKDVLGKYYFSTYNSLYVTNEFVISETSGAAQLGYVPFNNKFGAAEDMPDVKIAEKILTGKDLVADQFTFKLTPLIHGTELLEGYTLAESSETITLTNAANGDIVLDIGVFTKEFHDKYCYDNTNSDNIFIGAYAFLIEEVNAGEPGYTYDPGTYAIDVTFLDGELFNVAAMPYTKDEAGKYFFSTIDSLYVTNEWVTTEKATVGYVPFNNKYATAEDEPGVKIAEKILEGKKLEADEFTFKLTPFIPGASPTDSYTLADSGKTITLTNAENGDIYLDIGVFNKEFHDKYCYDETNADNIYIGAYAFLIEEVNDGKAGYTYDSKTYAIDVTFIEEKSYNVAAMPYTKDDSGKYHFSIQDSIYVTEKWLSDTATVGYVPFINKYATASTTASAAIDDSKLNVVKTLRGTALPAAQQFTFTLALKDGVKENVVMPKETSIKTEAITSGSANKIGFEDITFTAAGIYTFTITETDDKFEGMTYAPAQEVTVNVTSKDGVLTAEIVKSATDLTASSGELTFTNSYTPKLLAVDPPVRKEITGDTPLTKETFTFTMTAVSFTPVTGSSDAMTSAQMPMPEGSKDGVCTATVVGAGGADFGSYKYGIPGTYVYTVAEKAGSNPAYSYDKTVYTITDTVANVDGKLEYTRVITKGTTTVTECLFSNKYTQQMGELIISKTVRGDLASRTQQFIFTLTFSENGPFSYSGAKTGTISSGGRIMLRHGESVVITLPEGTTYSVTESGNYGYTVNATGDSGTISANTRDSAVFVNTRSSQPKTGDNSSLGFSIGAMLISAAGIYLISTVSRKRKKADK